MSRGPSLALLVAALTCACGPDGPRPCQDDAQCEEGEVCLGTSAAQAGSCVLATVVVDGGGEAGEDAGVLADGGPQDGPGPADGGPTDGGPNDGGSNDGGPNDGGPRGAFTVAAGGGFACALGYDGETYCWGYNSNGQLGHTDTAVNTPYEPRAVAGLDEADLLAAGADHACVRANQAGEPAIYCWGDNTGGQLGVPAGGVAGVPAKAALPDGVAASARELQAAASSTCLRTDDAEVYCWGPGVPGYVAGSPVHIVAFSGASALYHSNGASCARVQPGGVRCLSGPSLLASVCDPNAGGYHECDAFDDATRLRFSGSNVCQVSGTADLLSCAGDNTYGVVSPEYPTADTRALTPYDPGFSTARLGLGDQHVCALGHDQMVRCWGRNLYRATGQAEGYGGPCANDATGCHEPEGVPLPSVSGLSTRRGYSCAIDGEGDVWCWGWLVGQSGIGPTRTVIGTP